MSAPISLTSATANASQRRIHSEPRRTVEMLGRRAGLSGGPRRLDRPGVIGDRLVPVALGGAHGLQGEVRLNGYFYPLSYTLN